MPNQSLPIDWSEFVQARPECHLLQSPEWGALKSSFGWTTRYCIKAETGAQVLLRTLPIGLKLAYIPMGPIGNWLPGLVQDLDALCQAENAFMLKVEPDLPYDDDLVQSLRELGFAPSSQTIQPPRSIQIDLTGDEDAILARMKQKTRYNIRLADRKGVSIRPWDDLAGFAAMTQETAERDAFGAHNQAYFERAYELFHSNGKCELLVAEVGSEQIAALMVFRHGLRAWYLYGASRDAHREKMPAYLLQWEAMRWAKHQGCQLYDLWGIPDMDEPRLESRFSTRGDGLWGVYRFKRGFGGVVTRTIGAWDRVYSPAVYQVYKLFTRLRGRVSD